jgi:hypothetical protein
MTSKGLHLLSRQAGEEPRVSATVAEADRAGCLVGQSDKLPLQWLAKSTLLKSQPRFLTLALINSLAELS